MPRKLAAGNWKMNGSTAALAELTALEQAMATDAPDVVICPPFPYLTLATGTATKSVAIGAQDCHPATSGAHTGDVSADMLADLGIGHVIVGHSERRTDHDESDATIAAKTKAAWSAGLIAILCIGESAAERDAGQTLDVITRQLANSVPDGATPDTLVIAYEPIWAIGTGAVATIDQIAEVHAAIRAQMAQRFGDTGADIALLYGGSVKAGNAADIFAVKDVDGALVGGASLKASDFAPIVDALKHS
ncbi:MAG: triose-phosphate isomerase [Paracoccaceae bacterium]